MLSSALTISASAAVENFLAIEPRQALPGIIIPWSAVIIRGESFTATLHFPSLRSRVDCKSREMLRNHCGHGVGILKLYRLRALWLSVVEGRSKVVRTWLASTY
jgi:hypothetical protein